MEPSENIGNEEEGWRRRRRFADLSWRAKYRAAVGPARTAHANAFAPLVMRTPPMRTRPCFLLLVSEDASVIAAIHATLGERPHRLFVAPTVEAAISALAERTDTRFGALLVDLDIGSDGLALLGAIRTIWPHLPVIALVPSEVWVLRSALSKMALRSGASGLVDKPVRIGELADAVRHACACTGRRSMRGVGLDARRTRDPPRAME